MAHQFLVLITLHTAQQCPNWTSFCQRFDCHGSKSVEDSSIIQASRPTFLAVSELEGVIFILNGVSEMLTVGTGKKPWHERAPCVRRSCVTKVCMYNVHACGRKACMHQSHAGPSGQSGRSNFFLSIRILQVPAYQPLTQIAGRLAPNVPPGSGWNCWNVERWLGLGSPPRWPLPVPLAEAGGGRSIFKLNQTGSPARLQRPFIGLM